MGEKPEEKARPAWTRETPDKWPPSARLAYSIMADIAEEMIADEEADAKDRPAPGAA